MAKMCTEAEWARIIAEIKRREKKHPEAAKIARAIRGEQKLNKERDSYGR